MRPLSPFGKSLRKARIDTGQTLKSMSAVLGVSVAFLSDIERGGKSVPVSLVKKIYEFFKSLDYNPKENLFQLAVLQRGKLDLSHLSERQQILIVKLTSHEIDDGKLSAIEKIIYQRDES
jgi:toxin-antitoxin system, antitoxin component, xre family